MTRVVFRADGGSAIGSGHAMRCLALSQAFLSGGWSVGFACSRETFESVKALGTANIERLIIEGTIDEEPKAIAARWSNVDILVVDHYGRNARFEHACRAFSKRIVVIDDLADRSHDCDILVDSNAASEASYRNLVPANCRILTGPTYAPLAPEFRMARSEALARRDGRSVERVLLSFGQIDASNASELALRALADIGFKGEVDVAISRSAPHFSSINRRVRESSNVRLHADTSSMPALMTAADLALGAGGTTSWERCCLGLPSLMVELAKNQHGVINLIEKNGGGISLGPIEELSLERLREALCNLAADQVLLSRMGKAGFALVDGRGSERILLTTIGAVTTKMGEKVNVRLAEMSDEGWLLKLRQKSETRKFSNFARPSSAEEHKAWFQKTLCDTFRMLMIIEVEKEPVGMLRLDSVEDAIRINIAIDPTQYRRGLGAATLALTSRIAPRRPLEAVVKSENKASLALFKTAGYRKIGNDLYRCEQL